MKCLIATLFILGASMAFAQEDLAALAKDFFTWRTSQQPSGGDDIPRVTRPEGWRPQLAPADLQAQRTRHQAFQRRLESLDRSDWNRADYVDFLCLRAAIARVTWELDILRTPHRNPDFYVHQTLGSVYELLILSTPVDAARIRELTLRFQAIPEILDHARTNLTEPVAPFARIAMQNLDDVVGKLQAVNDGLTPHTPDELKADLTAAIRDAATALESYRTYLKQNEPKMKPMTPIGRESYAFFLKNIAMIPYSPETLLAMGRIEWDRSVAFETFAQIRNQGQPEPTVFDDAAAQIARSVFEEQRIRDFLEARNIMSVPDWMGHYLNRTRPAYLAPLAHMGVVDDLTSEERLGEDGFSFIPEPSDDLSFFYRASAYDPRPIIVHEGVPGHFFQMARSWNNERPIRRRYIDSGANEGIGFYVEEMLLQCGLFDDAPRTLDILYRFMRLRALRVEVDVKLALGEFSIEEAGDYLARTVPMDRATAVEEAGFFAYNPGQAITYQIGKIQIHQFLSDARTRKGEAFSLRDFHDYLMINGNVPIALLRWERLGLRDQIDMLFPGIPENLE